MCGMFSGSGNDYDYLYEFIECSELLPYVCEETRSGFFSFFFLEISHRLYKYLLKVLNNIFMYMTGYLFI